MKLAVTIQTPEVPKPIPVALLSGTLEEKFRKASQWGADGIEIMTTNPSELNIEELIKLFRNYHLEPAAISSGGVAYAAGLTLLHPDKALAELARIRLNDLIDFAHTLGATLVTIGSFRGSAKPFGKGALEKLTRIIEQAAFYAEKKQVRIAIEAVNRYEVDILNNSNEVLEFINKMNNPGLGLLLDTFHVNIEEQSWTEPFTIAMRTEKLLHVHLGDNNRLATGQGLIDFRAIVTTLQNNGYQGYLSAELLAKPDPDSAAKQTLIYMRKLLESCA